MSNKVLSAEQFIKKRIIQGMLLDENTGFVYIKELLDSEQFVNKAYSVILNRTPTLEEASLYEDFIRKGVPLQWVIHTIKKTSGGIKEKISIHGLIRPKSPSELLRLDGELFIQEVYRTLLWREADLQGIKNYLAELELGESKQTIINRIALSEEGCKVPDNHQFVKLDEQQAVEIPLEENVEIQLIDKPSKPWSSKAILFLKEYLRRIKTKIVKN